MPPSGEDLSCKSIRSEYNDKTSAYFENIADHLINIFSPTSVLDIESENGLLVAALKSRGVDAIGQSLTGLTKSLNSQYDLVVCIEILQCLTTQQSEMAIKSMGAVSDQLIISSAPKDFSDISHINVKESEDWAAMLAQYGFIRDLSIDTTFISKWAALYRREKLSLEEVVRSYERALRRNEEEVRQLRFLGQQLQEKVQGGIGSESDPELLFRENLNLRDALLGVEAARDESLAKERELSDELLRFRIAAGRLERIENSLSWRMMKPMRVLLNWLGRISHRSSS